ncbi:MAG: TIR domain-containing protein [Proteobacteria bacterium]|nr:TIR domain-containing protein [Pseudomonadota bacterium]
MADIFISYKREDRRVAERLSIALEQLGFDVWWDFELLSGDGYRKVIERVIDECAATVVLWSERSRESAFVIDEATYSREQSKLCPARIDDCRLPLGFGGDHVVDLRGWDGEMDHEGLQSLLRAIELKTGKKARLGAAPRGGDEEVRFAEMEAFKAAEAAGNASALQSFLRDYPQGAFANFVRGQLETMGVKAMAHTGGAGAPAQRRSVSEPPRAPPQPRTAPSVASPAPPRRRSSRLVLGGVAAAMASATLVFFVVMPRQVSAPPRPAVTSAETSQVYSLAGLNPDVRAAVEEARRNEALANAAAARAAVVGQRAEASIGHEQAGEDVRVFSGDHIGDRYAGQFENRYEGVGIYTWAQNAGNSFGAQSYAGEFADDAPNGTGIYTWRDGKRYAGQMAAWQRQGAGVFRMTDGRRYEGQWSGDRMTGLGVEWDAQGHLSRQGIWTNGELTTPLDQNASAK